MRLNSTGTCQILGRVVMSYDTIVGYVGEFCVYVTTKKYSVTTSKHITTYITRWAVERGLTVERVTEEELRRFV